MSRICQKVTSFFSISRGGLKLRSAMLELFALEKKNKPLATYGDNKQANEQEDEDDLEEVSSNHGSDDDSGNFPSTDEDSDEDVDNYENDDDDWTSELQPMDLFFDDEDIPNSAFGPPAHSMHLHKSGLPLEDSAALPAGVCFSDSSKEIPQDWNFDDDDESQASKSQA